MTVFGTTFGDTLNCALEIARSRGCLAGDRLCLFSNVLD